MAVEGLSIGAIRTLNQERILIAQDITLENIGSIITQNFSTGELVEVQLLNYTPFLFGKPALPETIEQRNRVSQIVTTQINRFVKGGRFETANFPTLTLWPGDIPFAGFTQNNIFLRWAAKTAEVNFENQILEMLSEIKIDLGPTGAPAVLDPIPEWNFNEINIFKYTQKGAGIIDREIQQQEGFFERLLKGTGNVLRLDLGGIPVLFWLAAGVIIIPEVSRTLREITPGE